MVRSSMFKHTNGSYFKDEDSGRHTGYGTWKYWCKRLNQIDKNNLNYNPKLNGLSNFTDKKLLDKELLEW